MSSFGAGDCMSAGFMVHGLNQMISENADTLFRSIRKLSSKDAKNTTKEWDDLTFQFAPGHFFMPIIGFAATPI